MAEEKEDLEEKKTASLDEGEAEGENKEGAEGGAAAAKKSPKKVLIFSGLGILVVLLGITGAYFMGFLGSVAAHKEGETAAEFSCEGVKEGDEKFEECKLQGSDTSGLPGVFLDIPDMIVNLKSDSSQPRFLKISLDVELQSEEDKAKFTPLMPRVIDQFQMYLRELRFEDLKGTAGIYRMKIELLNRIRSVTPNIKVNDILFQEILVQ